MSGPILAAAARKFGRLTEDDTLVAPCDRPYDPVIGPQQLSHCKQRNRQLEEKNAFLTQELEILQAAFEKKGTLVDYIKETVLKDMLHLLSDGKRVEYTRLVTSILDDDKLLALHQEIYTLLKQKPTRKSAIEESKSWKRKSCPWSGLS